MEQMVRIFGDMGLVEVRAGVEDDPGLPADDDGRVVRAGNPAAPPPSAAPAAARAVHMAPVHDPKDLLRRQAARQAGWHSESDREQAPLPVHWPKGK